MTPKPADLCFICLQPLKDGRELTTVGLGFVVHKQCDEEDE